MVKDDHSRHGLYHGYGPGKHAWVVASAGCQRRSVPLHIHSFLWAQERGYRLEGHAEVDILAIRDAALDAAAVVGGRCNPPVAVADEAVVHLRAAFGGKVETVAIFKALDGVDAKHGTA